MRAFPLAPTPVPPMRTAVGAALVLASVVIFAPDRIWIGCALGWTLVVLSLIDWQDGILPDLLTLPLTAVGLLVGGLPWQDSLLGALLGAGLLAVPALAYKRFRGQDGLGWGDVKLAAASGAWLGWQAIPAMILASALLGIAAVLVRQWLLKTSAREAIPFGPALAAATWIIWIVQP
jgi:leader peptidase (prepilin peptidase)/N-methyltransferase